MAGVCTGGIVWLACDMQGGMGMNKKYEVTAIGELLIDFIENGSSEQGNPILEANPGGAPCNVLAMLQRLGHSTAFLGKVGEDIFGRRLLKTLEEIGIDTTGLIMDVQSRTTLAFVEKKADGDRDFSFYRNPGADMMLTEEEIPEEVVRNTGILHFGTISMTHEPVRSATKKAVALARESGALLSFDPNLREPLWDSPDSAREQMAYGMSVCDILKISDNELQWFTGQEDYAAGIGRLRQEYRIPLILLTMGKDGSRAYYCPYAEQGKEDTLIVEVPALLQEKTIETTGAGDTFGGCCLHYLLQYGITGLTEERLREMLRFANAAASVITTRKGALRVMPEPEEIYALLQSS